MTLGGLALAVGILVDDATVEIENTNRNLEEGKEIRHAILDGASQIAVPALVSTLSICIVFLPMFFLSGVPKLPVCAPGRSGGVRHARFLSAVANAGSHAGAVPVEAAGSMENADRGIRLVLFQRAFERGFEQLRGGYRSLLETLVHSRLHLHSRCFW